MDIIYPYENISKLSLYMLTNKLIFHLKSTQSAGWDKKFAFQDLSFQIVNYSYKLFKSFNKIQIFHIY